jgi:type II secretory ATPase GspE/PulE/Tfp pilus assembly ATPase PilB-like protein
MNSYSENELNELLNFTDLYIVENDWEKSYYFIFDKNKDRNNNPPRLLTPRQKPIIKDFYNRFNLLKEQGKLKTKGDKLDYSFIFKGRTFRCYIIKASHGNVIACRQVFNKEIPLDKTGISKEIRSYLLHEDLNQGGLIIICGSNGSGKTTSCAALIRARLEAFGGYCLTIEDPVEIPIEGKHGSGVCLQIEVEGQFEFAPKVREIMRAYPTGQNLLMLIGETRDAETATQALRSAIDGRLVITTIHADGIQGALTRLLTLASDKISKIEAQQLLSHSFRVGIHQRLLDGELKVQFLLGTKSVNNKIKNNDLTKLIQDLEQQELAIKAKKDLILGNSI